MGAGKSVSVGVATPLISVCTALSTPQQQAYHIHIAYLVSMQKLCNCIAGAQLTRRLGQASR